MKKEYKLVSAKYLEHMVDDLNRHGDEGWSISAYLQEFGVTKVILEREIVEDVLGSFLKSIKDKQ